MPARCMCAISSPTFLQPRFPLYPPAEDGPYRRARALSYTPAPVSAKVAKRAAFDLPVVVSLLRHAGQALLGSLLSALSFSSPRLIPCVPAPFAGVLPRRARALRARLDADLVDAFPKPLDVVPPAVQATVRRAVQRYFDAAAEFLVTTYIELKKLEFSNRRLEFNRCVCGEARVLSLGVSHSHRGVAFCLVSGSLPEDRAAEYAAKSKDYDKLSNSINNLADLLDRDTPTLPEVRARVRLVVAAVVTI